MMADYANVLRAFARRQMPTSADIPDFRLMVGEAEFLDSIPLLLYTDIAALNTKAVTPALSEISAEQAAPNLQGVSFSNDDFGNDFYLGGSLGGD